MNRPGRILVRLWPLLSDTSSATASGVVAALVLAAAWRLASTGYLEFGRVGPPDRMRAFRALQVARFVGRSSPRRAKGGVCIEAGRSASALHGDRAVPTSSRRSR
jgi:hypothetical protein